MMATYSSRDQSGVASRPINEWNYSLTLFDSPEIPVSDLELTFATGSVVYAPSIQSAAIKASKSANDELPDQNSRSRDSGFSQQEWENKKDLIRSLYGRMTLDQLIIHMRDQYAFDAKRHMFLRRITQWGFNKNAKAEEKQVVADRMANNSGKLPPNTNIALHKVQRHIKSQQKPTRRKLVGKRSKQVGSNPSTVMRSTDLLRLNHAYSSNAVMTGDFVFIPSEQANEELLLALREYTTVRLEERQIPTRTVSKPSKSDRNVSKLVNDFWAHLRGAIFALDSHGYAETWAIQLDQACGLFKIALQQSHWRFVLRLVTELCKLMRLNSVVATKLLCFAQEMAHIVFGSNLRHCVVRVLDIFSSVYHQPEIFERAGQIVLQTVERQVPKDAELHHLAYRDVQFLYSACNLHRSAQDLAAAVARKRVGHDGGTDLKSREAHFRLSRCHLEIGDYERTRELLLSLLQMYHDANLPPDRISISAAEDLGVSCLHLGLTDEALQHLSSAVSTLDFLKVRWKTYQPHRNYCIQLMRNIRKWRIQSVPLALSEECCAELFAESVCGVADKDFQIFEMWYALNRR